MGTEIKNCNFNGIKWEGEALEAVNDVAKALLNMTKIFIGQNIQIDSMLVINNAVGEATAEEEGDNQ